MNTFSEFIVCLTSTKLVEYFENSHILRENTNFLVCIQRQKKKFTNYHNKKGKQNSFLAPEGNLVNYYFPNARFKYYTIWTKPNRCIEKIWIFLFVELRFE